MSENSEDRITESEVKKYRREVQRAPRESKVGRFYASNHYARLHREQNQGYHHAYIIFEGKSECTCGLVVPNEELKPELFPKNALRLQPMQQVAGHRNLPSCEGVTVALIVNFLFDWSLGDYLWTAYCQVCGKSVIEIRNDQAKAFVEVHNQSCQR